MKMLSGSCQCGAVRYFVADDFRYAGYCHCSACRKFSGAECSVAGGIPQTLLEVVVGQDNINRHNKSEATVLVFCRSCGSTLYAEKPLLGNVHVRYGTLDDEPTLKPQFHAFVASKAPWVTIPDDGLPRYAAAPPALASKAALEEEEQT